MPDRHPNVVNSDELPRHELDHGDNFAEATGGHMLGRNRER